MKQQHAIRVKCKFSFQFNDIMNDPQNCVCKYNMNININYILTVSSAGLTTEVRVQAGAKFSFRHCAHTGSAAHPAACSVVPWLKESNSEVD